MKIPGVLVTREMLHFACNLVDLVTWGWAVLPVVMAFLRSQLLWAFLRAYGVSWLTCACMRRVDGITGLSGAGAGWRSAWWFWG